MVLIYKKVSNFTSGGVQNREPKNRRLANIVKSFQDSKPREKQIFPTSSYLTNKEASTALCSVVKHAGSGRARKKCRGKCSTAS